MEITHTSVIDAPIDRLWALTLDVEGLPAITPTITKVELLDPGPVTVASRARLSQPGISDRIWTVEEATGPTRFSWATTLLGVRMIGVHALRAIGPNRTELTLAVVFEGRGAKLLGRLSARKLVATLAAEADGFAKAAATAAA